ncbi:uncharacterized protein A1O9_05582 [Exophiala aquamarina CBS 119918]|uniref:Enoyl reductase (ER) domain-containing protein n=1 Tax=Exophiala aquamarina CBS 119918 TaxID=1182545 RepID=A0A072PC28_9EURO|nr:uncharacterized protein A1O9_05582 [Exophiala aquamarina CBS 119918]KEF57664.1 hypothetical protein A1O9_05582 [Exophiala aquamarina CBS 119918]
MAAATLPSEMRALLHNIKDQSLVIKSVPLPIPGPQEYLVKPLAAAFTVGELFWPRPEELSVSTPGVEYVGQIVQSPSATSKFQRGDRVYARVTYPRPGAARQYTVTTEDEIARTPRNFTTAEAASVPVSALAAWQALFEEFKIEVPTINSTHSSSTRPRLLITAASGSVGIYAVQLAKLAGLYVVATAGPRNIDLVKSLGADEVLDYTTTDLRTWVAEDPSRRKVDFAFALAGGSSLEQAWHTVKDNGQLLTIVPPPDFNWVFDLDTPDGVSSAVTGRFWIMHPSGAQLEKITELIEAGKLRPLVDSVWEFEDYNKAIERLNSGKTSGKVVLKVNAEQ